MVWAVTAAANIAIGGRDEPTAGTFTAGQRLR